MKFLPIEHSENNNIRLFENKIRPGVLQSGIEQTRVLQEYQRYKPRTVTDYMSILSLLCEFLQIPDKSQGTHSL